MGNDVPNEPTMNKINKFFGFFAPFRTIWFIDASFTI